MANAPNPNPGFPVTEMPEGQVDVPHLIHAKTAWKPTPAVSCVGAGGGGGPEQVLIIVGIDEMIT